MKYTVSIDVPDLEKGVRFYADAFGFKETARPVETYAVMRCGDANIGLLEKAEDTLPAKGAADRRRYERHWTPVHIDFHVAAFEETLENALAAGALCEEKFEIEGRPPVAFCSDPFGNGFCIIGEE